MKSCVFFSIGSCMLILLLASSFPTTLAQSSFVPAEWSEEVSSSQQCGLTNTPELSDALATVVEMIKGNDIASSLPKSCMEIKESSPVSPSGYYTISNESGGSVVVYCNMDELYSCPSLEQTLKGFSSTLLGFTNTVTDISSAVTGVSSAVTDVSSAVTDISSTVTDVSSSVMEVSSAVTDVSSAVTEVSNNVSEISGNLEGVSNTLETNSACEKISTSCQEVQNKCPECTSGYYKILSADLTEKYVYCSFEEKCGTAGPWTRAAYLNMSDSSSMCPSGTQKFVSGSAIACGIKEPSDPLCLTVTSSVTQAYSEICGQVAGYQKGSADGFLTGQTDIDGIYVEGVSITRGSPRQHVWSYAVGLQENFYVSGSNPGVFICPCGATSTMPVPSVVGSDYYCESGCAGNFDLVTIYSDDVLWDGQQCGVLETGCCTNTDQPWFHKVLDTTTSDGIEIRLCINQHTNDENILVSLYDIYVK